MIGQLHLKGRNRFSRGFKLLAVVVALVSTLYAALLYVNLMHNQRTIEQGFFDTAHKNAASLIAFVDHEGFRERIFDDNPPVEKPAPAMRRSMANRSSLLLIPSSVRSTRLFPVHPCTTL